MIFRKLFDMYAAYFMINGNFWLLHELELSSVDKPDVDSRDRALRGERAMSEWAILLGYSRVRFR